MDYIKTMTKFRERRICFATSKPPVTRQTTKPNFYKDGKAYSVEFDVSPSTSDTIQPIVNSIH